LQHFENVKMQGRRKMQVDSSGWRDIRISYGKGSGLGVLVIQAGGGETMRKSTCYLTRKPGGSRRKKMYFFAQKAVYYGALLF
jgi:hypothetical protein